MDGGEAVGEPDEFKLFLISVLSPALPPQFVQVLTMDDPVNIYFRRAFTHRTTFIELAARKGIFDYDVFEKIGDRVLKVVFQLWLFDFMGQEVTTPQLYSDMEKKLTDTQQLNELATRLNFRPHIRVGEGNVITDQIVEDVMEAFMGALTLAADAYIAKDIGLSLAKRWIFQVYNTHVRPGLDPTDIARFVDYRTRINEIWTFNDWKRQDYRTTGDAKAIREAGVVGFAAVDLYAPNANNIPQNLRGRRIGSGVGRDLDEAKEAAAKNALETLELNYPDLKGLNLDFAALDTARLERILASQPELLVRLKRMLAEAPDRFSQVSIRRVRMGRRFIVQLRVADPKDRIPRHAGRYWSDTSEDDAIRGVLEPFLANAGF